MTPVKTLLVPTGIHLKNDIVPLLSHEIRKNDIIDKQIYETVFIKKTLQLDFSNILFWCTQVFMAELFTIVHYFCTSIGNIANF